MAKMSRRKRQRILCIEDDCETARLVAEELYDWGFEVDIAYNGCQGIEAIRKRPPDLVLCDVCMPGMSGLEVLQRVRTSTPRFDDSYFIFLTALAGHDNELKTRQIGAVSCVTKPIDFDRLVRIVTARLASRGDVAFTSIDVVDSSDLGSARARAQESQGCTMTG